MSLADNVDNMVIFFFKKSLDIVNNLETSTRQNHYMAQFFAEFQIQQVVLAP